MDLKRIKLIQAPAATIFECVVDDQLIPRWMEELESIEYLEPVDPERDPVGVQFRQKVREGFSLREYRGEVTVYEQDKHFGIAFGDRRFRFLLDYRIDPGAGGSRLSYHLRTTEESFLMRLAAGAVKTMATNMVDRNLRKLKAFAEGRVQERPGYFA